MVRLRQILPTPYQFEHAPYALSNFQKLSSILDLKIQNLKNTIRKSKSHFGKVNSKCKKYISEKKTWNTKFGNALQKRISRI